MVWNERSKINTKQNNPPPHTTRKQTNKLNKRIGLCEKELQQLQGKGFTTDGKRFLGGGVQYLLGSWSLRRKWPRG